MSFFSELQRRNVVRVGVAYTVVAWVVAQVAEFAFESFGAPDWAIRSLVVLLLIGLVPVLIFAWVYEMTPEGLRREKDVDRSTSITPQTGRRIDRVIIATLTVAVASAGKKTSKSRKLASRAVDSQQRLVMTPVMPSCPTARHRRTVSRSVL